MVSSCPHHFAVQRTLLVHHRPQDGNTGITNRINAAMASGNTVKRIEIKPATRPLTKVKANRNHGAEMEQSRMTNISTIKLELLTSPPMPHLRKTNQKGTPR